MFIIKKFKKSFKIQKKKFKKSKIQKIFFKNDEQKGLRPK